MKRGLVSSSGRFGRVAVFVIAVGLVPLAVTAGRAGGAAVADQHRVLAAAGDISTVAGGPGGPALGTRLAIGQTCGVTWSAGVAYIGDEDAIRRLGSQGKLSVVAGTDFVSPYHRGALATTVGLRGVCSTAVDSRGNLVFLDPWQETADVVPPRTGVYYQQSMTAGHVYPVAGGGSQPLRSGVAAGQVRFTDMAGGMAIDAAGNLVIVNGNQIWVVAERSGSFYGQAMRAGRVYLVAGTGAAGFSGDGGPGAAATLDKPGGVSTGAAGNLLIADAGNNRIRVLAAVSGTFYGRAMTQGDIYTVAGSGRSRLGDGGPATAASLATPEDAVTDARGNLVIADSWHQRVRVVAERTATMYGQAMTAGDIYTVAGNGRTGHVGDGHPATRAEFVQPVSVAVDGQGDLLIADEWNYRIRLVAEHTGSAYGHAVTTGDVYTVAGRYAPLGFSSGPVTGGLPATSAQFYPEGVATDPAGDLAITSFYQFRTFLVPAVTGTHFGRTMRAGHIYTVVGNGRDGVTGNGVPGTKTEVSEVDEAVFDHAGNLIFSDFGNNLVRVLAATTGTFYGQAMTAGDVYTIAGTGAQGFSGDGGPAIRATLASPQAVSVDAAGNLVIADTLNDRIRVVAERTGTFYGRAMTAGDIYTIAGTGREGTSGDGGPATAAELNLPDLITVASDGNVLLSSIDDERIRVVAESTGTFYGRAMTAGDIYTIATSIYTDGIATDAAGNVLFTSNARAKVFALANRSGTFYGQAMTAGQQYAIAGNGTDAYYGDGGPATAAELSTPAGIAVDARGDVLFADQSALVREITG